MAGDYRALAALAIRLRRIWRNAKVVTPKMVVDSMKALYTFITGKVASCLVLAIFMSAPTVAAEYNLIRPKTSGRYSLAPKVFSQPVETPRSKTSSKPLASRRRLSEAERPNKVIVVSATWCQPCKRMYPIIEQLKADGYDAEVVYDYDGPATITAYPTILFMRDDKVIYKNVGVTSDRVLRFNLVKP